MKMETMHAPAVLVLLLLAAACGAPGQGGGDSAAGGLPAAGGLEIHAAIGRCVEQSGVFIPETSERDEIFFDAQRYNWVISSASEVPCFDYETGAYTDEWKVVYIK